MRTALFKQLLISKAEDCRPKGTILHELLVAYLATAGLSESDVEFISMGIPDSQAAYQLTLNKLFIISPTSSASASGVGVLSWGNFANV